MDNGVTSEGVALTPELRPRWQDPVAGHVLALLLTFVSTTFAGAFHWAAFTGGVDAPPGSATSLGFWVGGLAFSLPVLGILGAHELGHYLACRYYDVDATLPWFLPAPLPLTGTLGAFIRLREPIPNARALFDIARGRPPGRVRRRGAVAGRRALRRRRSFRCRTTAAAWCSATRCSSR